MTRTLKLSLVCSVAAIMFAATLLSSAPASAGAGRYKAGPNGQCVWDPNDNGPDQCKPPNVKPKGRYKLDGNRKCYWEPNDDGPNQCEPPK